MILAAAFALLAAVSVLVVTWLARARWPYRAPRAAIFLWQAAGFAGGLALIGAALAMGLAPYDRGVALGLAALTRDLFAGEPASHLAHGHVIALIAGLLVAGGLIASLLASAVQVFLARRRHRHLLSFVAHDDPSVPGVLVLDHPSPAAYCLPGVRARVVVSAGTLRLLGKGELAAVLAHERAHARERHELVLLPFTSLRRVLPRLAPVSRIVSTVHLLVEMRADDRARDGRSARELAMALLRFGAARRPAAPGGTLAVGEHEVVARVDRLLEPPAQLPRQARLTVVAGAALLLVLPAVLLALPLA